jgi:hypothetical protein
LFHHFHLIFAILIAIDVSGCCLGCCRKIRSLVVAIFIGLQDIPGIAGEHTWRVISRIIHVFD